MKLTWQPEQMAIHRRPCKSNKWNVTRENWLQVESTLHVALLTPKTHEKSSKLLCNSFHVIIRRRVKVFFSLRQQRRRPLAMHQHIAEMPKSFFFYSFCFLDSKYHSKFNIMSRALQPNKSSPKTHKTALLTRLLSRVLCGCGLNSSSRMEKCKLRAQSFFIKFKFPTLVCLH